MDTCLDTADPAGAPRRAPGGAPCARGAVRGHVPGLPLLHCSLLRATGTAARIRCGFGTYFRDDWCEDHWVTEYRLPDGSWRLVDPQVLHPSYRPDFDPLDVPRDRFVVAGQAWRACREGRADPLTFGFSPVDGLRGLWFVRANVRQDLAALNGVEVLSWDGWGPEIVVQPHSAPLNGVPWWKYIRHLPSVSRHSELRCARPPFSSVAKVTWTGRCR
jgi:hypothetical protein